MKMKIMDFLVSKNLFKEEIYLKKLVVYLIIIAVVIYLLIIIMIKKRKTQILCLKIMQKVKVDCLIIIIMMKERKKMINLAVFLEIMMIKMRKRKKIMSKKMKEVFLEILINKMKMKEKGFLEKIKKKGYFLIQDKRQKEVVCLDLWIIKRMEKVITKIIKILVYSPVYLPATTNKNPLVSSPTITKHFLNLQVKKKKKNNQIFLTTNCLRQTPLNLQRHINMQILMKR